MPKRGISHTKERIQIVNRYIRLFGKETIQYLVADREFVGEHWIYKIHNQLYYLFASKIKISNMVLTSLQQWF